MESYTQKIAAYISAVDYGDLPSDVVDTAKALIRDNFACIIGGSVFSTGKIVADFFIDMQGKPESTILGRGIKVPCLHAVCVNSYLANVLDFDDTGSLNPGHPGATIIPPAFAVAEKIRHVSGKQLIAAVVAGYEAWGRITRAIAPSPEARSKANGFGIYQVFGAAAVTANLLKFTPVQVANTLGLAGSAAPISNQWKIYAEVVDGGEIPWLKNDYGWVSTAGVLAALYTGKGIVGLRNILDGQKGYWSMAGSDQCDFDIFTDRLGEKYYIKDVAIKPYASCRFTHGTLDAVSKLQQDNQINPRAIKSIEVETFAEGVEGFASSHPENLIKAQFSQPYLVALELLDKSPRKGLFTQDLNDPVVTHLAEKVKLKVSAEMEKARQQRGANSRLSQVTIEMENGVTFRQVTRNIKGSPDNPLSGTELRSKFLQLVEPVTGAALAQELCDDLSNLEKIEDISVLINKVRS